MRRIGPRPQGLGEVWPRDDEQGSRWGLRHPRSAQVGTSEWHWPHPASWPVGLAGQARVIESRCGRGAEACGAEVLRAPWQGLRRPIQRAPDRLRPCGLASAERHRGAGENRRPKSIRSTAQESSPAQPRGCPAREEFDAQHWRSSDQGGTSLRPRFAGPDQLVAAGSARRSAAPGTLLARSRRSRS